MQCFYVWPIKVHHPKTGTVGIDGLDSNAFKNLSSTLKYDKEETKKKGTEIIVKP